MTREEAKEELWQRGNINTLGKVDANEIIDKIYDDFESRICKNCKHYESDWCCDNAFVVDEIFGCNRFEPKDER